MGFFGKKKEIDILLDLDLIENSYENVHMKNMALHTNIDLIARTISQLEFLVVKNGEYIKDRLYYKLNVKPNKNQNAYEFWKQFVENIFYENECLIIKTDSDDLVIADFLMYKLTHLGTIEISIVRVCYIFTTATVDYKTL